METRPKIKLQLSFFDRALETAGLIGLVILWGLTTFAYFNLPNTIPIHFGISGKPDNYGSKATLYVMPVLGTIIFYGLTILNKHPDIFNYMMPITEENAPRQYGYATRTLRFLKCSIMVTLNLVVLFAFLNVIGKIEGIGAWFLPFILGLILIPTAYYIFKALKTK